MLWSMVSKAAERSRRQRQLGTVTLKFNISAVARFVGDWGSFTQCVELTVEHADTATLEFLFHKAYDTSESFLRKPRFRAPNMLAQNTI